ncbi:MAG: L,D-transpeptidase family protein [Magnetococcales bacterium]|nr:L,D-transpeptidase family protein [Magnetococcales bacterium]MBF0154985.1 L,D-transpeptidase family protein [Magnetococcales bacterium]
MGKVCRKAPTGLLILLGGIFLSGAWGLVWAESLGPFSPLDYLSATERSLIKGLEAVLRHDLDGALREIGELTRQRPDFRLAHLIQGDLLMAKAGDLRGFGHAQESDPEVMHLLDEARVRIHNYLDSPPKDAIPQNLIYLAHAQGNAIVVDITRSRLYLFRRVSGRPELIANYYISSGKNGSGKILKGDKKTPVGLYFITDYLPGYKLPPMYGLGAMPINYPNEWDRLLKKTGDGIWLHGTPPLTYSRPPMASDGCVALTNIDFETIGEVVGIGTPVIISNAVEWLDPVEWRGQLDWFLSRIQEWHKDWISGKVERVLRHYSPDFQNNRFDHAGWTKYLRRQFQEGTTEETNFSDISILGYPTEQRMIVVTFTQEVRGKELFKQPLRRQYWRLEKDLWKIVYEDTG